MKNINVGILAVVALLLSTTTFADVGSDHPRLVLNGTIKLQFEEYDTMDVSLYAAPEGQFAPGSGSWVAPQYLSYKTRGPVSFELHYQLDTKTIMKVRNKGQAFINCHYTILTTQNPDKTYTTEIQGEKGNRGFAICYPLYKITTNTPELTVAFNI